MIEWDISHPTARALAQTQTKQNIKAGNGRNDRAGHTCNMQAQTHTTQTNMKSAMAAMIERDISHGSTVKNTVKNAA